MGGTALVCLLLPAAAAAGGATGLCALILCMGLLQGPFGGALSELNRVWMPLGSERIWAQRLQVRALSRLFHRIV